MENCDVPPPCKNRIACVSGTDQCAAKARLHFLKDIGKGLTSVTHLHHGHTRSVIIEQFCLCLLKHFLRKY